MATKWMTQIAPSLCFTIVLAVYVATTPPTVAGGGSGELLAEGCQLGKSRCENPN